MRFSLIATGLAILSTTSTAQPTARAALASTPPLQVTNLVITDQDAANTNLTFTVYNPDPLTNASAQCTGSWSHAQNDWPTDEDSVVCGSSTFAWHLENYNSARDFTLGLQHKFKDPSLGEPPYDTMTVFGRGQVNQTYVSYMSLGGNLVGNQIEGTTIYAPIYAVAA